MQKLIQSLFVKLSVIFILIISVLTLYFYGFSYIPSHEALLRAELFDRIKTVFALSVDTLAKAIQSSDDITVLSHIESIMKVADVSTVYVLDNNQKVMTHDKTEEWGKTYTDDISMNAVEAKKVLRQTISGGYLFSTPLTSSATLCVGISSQKLDESISAMNKNAALTGAIIFIICSGAFIWFVYTIGYLKFTALRGGLNSLELGGGRLPKNTSGDEFGELQRLINSVLEKTVQNPSSGSAPENAKKLEKLVESIANNYPAGILVTNSENKIISFNSKAVAFIGVQLKDSAGKHVLEVVKLQPLIELIKKAAEKPGMITEDHINGSLVKAQAIAGSVGSSICGTVVYLN